MAASTSISSHSSFAVLAAIFLLVSFCVVLSAGERVLGEETDEFDFDGLPGAQHEFKVDVPGGIEDCFFQRVVRGAKLHVSFEVLRGGDRSVNVILRNSRWQVINAHHWKSQGVFEFEVPYDDTYAVCVDNSYGRFSAKLVYLYIVSFVMADWAAYVKEFEDIHSIADNVTQLLANVDLSVQDMKKAQTQSRFHLVRDWYLIWANNRYVQNWSIAQCVVIMTTSIIQVVFVRRLFKTTNVTPTAKPRA